MKQSKRDKILVDAWNDANPVGSPVRVVYDNGRVCHSRIKAPAIIDATGQISVRIDALPGRWSLGQVVPDTDQAAFEAAGDMREKCAMECARIEAAERRCGEDAGRSEIEREAHWNRSFAAGELEECISALPLSGGQPLKAMAREALSGSLSVNVDMIPVGPQEEWLRRWSERWASKTLSGFHIPSDWWPKPC